MGEKYHDDICSRTKVRQIEIGACSNDASVHNKLNKLSLDEASVSEQRRELGES